ncbi:MAG: hypothetical protein MSG64_17985 [Pyrinomonadaceae bacterium MAG19_C2-C3]|nr:hypothetical protein [Pyrinomonadaceae bacterium MAG19_C2-C3]
MYDPQFDRAFTYDYVGRLRDAYTGSEAYAFLGGTPHTGTATGPYRQTYQHDAWDNMTQRANRFWSQSDTHTAAYADGKRNDASAAGWQYDAAGNLTQDEAGSSALMRRGRTRRWRIWRTRVS